jgi:hypothetical protein
VRVLQPRRATATPSTVLRLGPWRVRLAEPSLGAALEPALEALARGEDPPDAERVKQTRKREVLRFPLAEGGSVYLKRERGPRSRWRGSGMAREYENLRRVRAAGFAAVEPLAIAERRAAGVCDVLLITRALPDAVPLSASLRSTGSASSLALRAQAAGLARRLHEARLWHRDLHAGNPAAPGRRALVGGPPEAARASFPDSAGMARTRARLARERRPARSRGGARPHRGGLRARPAGRPRPRALQHAPDARRCARRPCPPPEPRAPLRGGLDRLPEREPRAASHPAARRRDDERRPRGSGLCSAGRVDEALRAHGRPAARAGTRPLRARPRLARAGCAGAGARLGARLRARARGA